MSCTCLCLNDKPRSYAVDADEDRQASYRELFRNHIDSANLHEIGESLNHELVLGRSYFKDKIEEITNRQTRLGIPGRPMIGEDGAVYVVY